MDKVFSKFAAAIRATLSLLTATALCGCSNHPAGEQPVIDPAAKRIVKVTAHTPDYCDDTRVTFSPKDGGYYTRWSGDEEFKIAEYVDDMLGWNPDVKTEEFYSEDGKRAYFSFTLKPNNFNDSFSYYLAYPYYAVGVFYDDIIADECSVEFTLPAKQKPLEEGCADTEAILMFAKVEGLEEQPETINATFEHIISYGFMKLLLPEVGTNIKCVSFATNQRLAGTFNYYWNNQDKPYQDFSNSSYSITIDVSAISVDDEGILNVWFATLPTDTITEFTVTATTVDNRTYTTTVSVPAEKEFGFEVGRVSKFGVDMIGVQAE